MEIGRFANLLGDQRLWVTGDLEAEKTARVPLGTGAQKIGAVSKLRVLDSNRQQEPVNSSKLGSCLVLQLSSTLLVVVSGRQKSAQHLEARKS